MTGIIADLIGTADIYAKTGTSSSRHSNTPPDFFKQTFNLSAHSHILPYQTIDSDSIFHNQDSYGCGIQVLLNKTNLENIISLLLDVFETLPKHIDCTIILSQPHPSTLSQPALCLRPLQCYLFLSTRTSRKTLLTYRKKFELKLEITKQKHRRLGKVELLLLIRTWLTHPSQFESSPSFVNLNQRAFHSIIAPMHTIITPQPESLQIDYLDALNYPRTQNVINCHLDILTKHESDKSIVFKSKQHSPGAFLFSITLRPHTIKNTIHYFHNMVLITQGGNPFADLKKSQARYQAYGYQLKPTKSHQSICLLSSLPFFLTDRYAQSCVDPNLFHISSRSQLSKKVLPLLYHTAQQYLASFDENQIPSYDDTLPGLTKNNEVEADFIFNEGV